jgi:hypothetical protein
MYRSYADVYGSSKTSSHRQQMLGFAPTSSMVGSGEKLGTDPRIDQSTCYGLCQEHFSRKQWPYSPLSMTREWLPRTGTARRKRTPDVRGLVWETYVLC